jgi:hypothetical protein
MHETNLQQNLARLFTEPDFAALDAKLRQFDPFKVLKVERYELRHTTTLAWLLDPQQSHGLGDGFLRCFLQETGSAAFAAPGEALAGRVAVQAELRLSDGMLHSPVTGDGADAAASSVRTTGELDVLVESEGWALAIEAKIDSREGQAQLLDYSRYLGQRFGGRKELRQLYLTVQQETDVIEANPGWIGIQWGEQVARALRTALYRRYEAEPAQALVRCPSEQRALCEFLHRYLDLLERLDERQRGDAALLQPLADTHYETLAALKAALRRHEDAGAPVLPWSASPTWAGAYWEHRPLLDLLIGRLRPPEAGFAAAVLERLDASRNMPVQRLDSESGTRATFRFVPRQWMDWRVSRDGREAPLHTLMFYHVAFRAAYKDIEIKLLLPRTAEHGLQLRLVEGLLVQQQARGTQSLEPSATHLAAFLASPGSSLKLYSDKLGWDADGAGRTLREGADAKIGAFWEAVAEHTALLEKVLAGGAA